MEVIPKLDMTAATRYVYRSDLFFAILSATRTVEICCPISSSSAFSTVGWSCDLLSEVMKQTVRVRVAVLNGRILAGRRWLRGEKRRKQPPAPGLGFGPRKGFRPARLGFTVAAAQIPAAMAPLPTSVEGEVEIEGEFQLNFLEREREREKRGKRKVYKCKMPRNW